MKYFLFALVSLFVFAACNSQEKSESSTVKWSQGMQMFRTDINDLAPYLFSEKNYSDPKNKDVIEKKLNKFLEHSHGLSNMKSGDTPDHDPALKIASQELETNLKLGISSFKKGRANYSRMVVRESLAQCFHCHTRNDVGPKYKYSGSLSPKIKSNLGPLELVDYYVAVRNFQMARKTLKTYILDDTFRKSYPLKVEQALRKLLAITIRVQRDFEGSIELLTQFSKLDGFTKAIQKSIPLWIGHLKSWKGNTAKTCSEPFQTGSSLVAQAEGMKSSDSYYGADVLYLRATSCLHDYLKAKSEDQSRAKALFALGKSYGFLGDISFWNLSETYYEACIKTVPHTKLAKSCYQNWEDTILVGYSGSGGVFIPNSVAEKRSQLKKLAH